MELVQLLAATVEGVEGYLVQVEISRSEPSTGVGRTTVVGLPDAAVRESIERVTPAIFSSGLTHRPADHLVVNLAPADRRKEGPAFDLAVALGFACTVPENKLPPPPRDALFLAELALDGALRPVRGVLACALAAREAGLRHIVVAAGNAQEAAVVEGLRVLAPGHLAEVCEWVRSGLAGAPCVRAEAAAVRLDGEGPDLSDVRGQEHAKRALVVAAAGGHNLLMMLLWRPQVISSPATGDLMAKRKAQLPPAKAARVPEKGSSPRAYSYIRFSHPDQAGGDSFRRQSAMAEEYAQKHGLILDKEVTYRDLGVSAFRGRNSEVGMLGEFVEAVRTGLVPSGSTLLVESLDRVSRQTARKALRTLEDIIDLGVRVVTLSDSKVYDKESLDNDPTSLLFSILIFLRAHEESEIKSRRLSAAWGAKKEKARETGKVMTARTPGWIELDRESGKLRLIPGRAKVVARIFEMTLGGFGKEAIAARLNEEEIRCFGNGKKRTGKFWRPSYIAKILRNESVIGTCIPHKITHDGDGRKARTPLQAIPGYFPPAIDEETYRAVAALIDSDNPQRGRHAARPISSMLAGLARCPLCSEAMTRVNKGADGGHPYLVCTKAKVGMGCSYHAVKCSAVEEALVEHASLLLGGVPSNDDDLERQISSREAGYDEAQERAGVLLHLISKEPSDLLRTHLRDLEEHLKESKAELDALHTKRANTAGPLLQKRANALLEALEAPSKNIPAINLLMRQLFRVVTVNYPNGDLDFHWKSGAGTQIHFAWPVEVPKGPKRKPRQP